MTSRLNWTAIWVWAASLAFVAAFWWGVARAIAGVMG
jgi:hypothetical protein